jgi:hypothetical protein
MRKLLLSVAALLWGIGLGLAEDSPLFHHCLRGSENPEEAAKSEAACTAYLAGLMEGVRFGIVTPQQQQKPFCLPRRDLTNEETNFIFQKIIADNPQLASMDAFTAQEIAAVVVVKASKCAPSN